MMMLPKAGIGGGEGGPGLEKIMSSLAKIPRTRQGTPKER